MQLTAKNGEGNIVTQSLPTLITQVFFDKKISLLAVIFDVKNSPDEAFYPHFSAKNPEEIPALRRDFLWEKHCYELFLAFEKAENSPYVEINFSPSGEFNLYHFDSYRTPQQMPPRRLNIGKNQGVKLLNVYRINHETSEIFWQDNTLYQQGMQATIEENFPLSQDNHRLVMMVDVRLLVTLLKVENLDNIWLNPCSVYKSEQEMTYFAHQHTRAPDFHDKKYWFEV